jgi:protein SCO1/2
MVRTLRNDCRLLVNLQSAICNLQSLLAISLLLALRVSPVHGQSGLPPVLRPVGFDQRLDAQVPLDLGFKDEMGQSVQLGDYFGSKPVILVLAYYRCPMLCTQVLNGLVRALLDITFDVGKEFNVVTVSFDARETPALAAAKKKTYLERYGRRGAEAGWHFLTGEEDSIRRLTQAVGFRYTYDARNDQFAHASGIMILTPRGRISRYFYDITYSPRDVRLGLVEASANQIGSPVDQILLYCFHYDPAEGKYGPVIMNFVRLGGVLTLLALGALLTFLWREEWRKARQSKAAGSVAGLG